MHYCFLQNGGFEVKLYFGLPAPTVTPLSVGDGKVCTIVKTAINCSGGGTTQTNCPSIGNCTQGSC